MLAGPTSAPRLGRGNGIGPVALARAPAAALLCVLLVELGRPYPVLAETETAQLGVSATVLSGCTLTGGTLDFGTYTAGQPNPRDAAGQISFTNCSGTLTFELDGGQAGSVAARRMTSGSATLAYQLFQTSTRNSVWGVGVQAYELQLLGATPVSGNVIVHGRIPGGQLVPAGTYVDTVTITLTIE